MNVFPAILAAVSLVLSAHVADAQEAPKDFWAFHDMKFPYDREARAKRMSGTGVFRLRIDEKTGEVTNVVVVKSTGWKHLDEAAARTLVRWKARTPPARRAVTVPVTFLNTPPRWR